MRETCASLVEDYSIQAHPFTFAGWERLAQFCRCQCGNPGGSPWTLHLKLQCGIGQLDDGSNQMALTAIGNSIEPYRLQYFMGLPIKAGVK